MARKTWQQAEQGQQEEQEVGVKSHPHLGN